MLLLFVYLYNTSLNFVIMYFPQINHNIFKILQLSSYNYLNITFNNNTQLVNRLPSRPAMLQVRRKSKSSYTVRTLNKQDQDPVIKFLNSYFFQDEPLSIAVKLLETLESRCTELEEFAVSTLVHRVSVAALDENGQLVGIVINGIINRDANNATDGIEQIKDLKFRQILKVLSHLEREARIWDKLPKSCTKVLDVKMAATHPDWRGRGIMKVLCDETERLARSVGASALRMLTTSSFSAAAAERLKYKKVYGVFYKDLPGAPHVDPPHHEAKVYIKEL